jgi:hypothetical protein
MREYSELLQQVPNVTNYKLGGEFKTLTAKDEELKLDKFLEKTKNKRRRK